MTITQMHQFARPSNRPYFTEIMDSASRSEDPIKVLSDAITSDKRLSYVLGYAINPKARISDHVPKGFPEFKLSKFPLGYGGVDVLSIASKLYVLLNPAIQLKKKEEFLVQWLEAMPPQEANALIAIKDQTLQDLYPSLTNDVIWKSLGWTEEQYKGLFQ